MVIKSLARLGPTARMSAVLSPLAVGMTLVCLAVPASATFPGKNGGFAYSFELDYATDDVSYTVWSWRVGFVGQDGTGRHYVAAGTAPAFSPDGRKLAVSAVGTGDWPGLRPTGWGTRVLPLTGKPITRPTFGIDMAPAWSPDGRRLVFERDRCVGISESEYCPRARGIWMVAARGGGKPRRLTSAGQEPTWSSRNEIAFVYMPEYECCIPPAPRPQLSLIGPEGDEPRLLAFGRSPDWSPSGTQLAYSSENGRDIFVINRDGTSRRRLYHARGRFGYAGSPTWSPDGRKIAFLYDDDRVGAVAAQGGPMKRLFHLPCPPRLCSDGSTSSVTKIAWQPLPRSRR
jgi:Tol biopolymer transport system component